MDLNHYLLCLLLAYCIYSITGRVGNFGGIGCAEVFCFQFFLIQGVFYPSVEGLYAFGTDVVWLRRSLCFFKCFGWSWKSPAVVNVGVVRCLYCLACATELRL